jgi:hypothetical protein
MVHLRIGIGAELLTREQFDDASACRRGFFDRFEKVKRWKVYAWQPSANGPVRYSFGISFRARSRAAEAIARAQIKLSDFIIVLFGRA